jgi:hypothetical protein
VKLLVHRNLRDVQVIEATRVVVEDNHGNPIAVALEFAPNQILAVTADAPEFNDVLAGMGIRKTVVVTDVDQTPLNEVRFDNT